MQQCQAYRADNTPCPHPARLVVVINKTAIRVVCGSHYNHRPKQGYLKEAPDHYRMDVNLLQSYQIALKAQAATLRQEIEQLTGQWSTSLNRWEEVTDLLRMRQATHEGQVA